jgi:predicted polyphosphate/ATP-dependent NAD kinase
VRVGLVVNPIAGLGGRVGLKGTDGAEVVARALALGAVPAAGARAARALARLRADAPAGSFQLLAAPGPMGEEAARTAGLAHDVVDQVSETETSAEDTRRIAHAMAADVDLLLFAGGDGTAADVLASVGGSVPALGIPAGVKIHSGVYAVSPEAAGRIAAGVARGSRLDVAEAEVLDLDEDAYRRGEIAPRLLGYLRVPREPRLVQSRKAPSPAGERVATEAIAADVVEHMEPGRAYVLGPGTTVRAVAERLGVTKTLVGIDVVRDGALVAADAAERDLLEIVEDGPAAIVVTPIGGQGFVFGRGNQQIGPAVVSRVGREHLLVLATSWKLASLGAAPLRVDTGDLEVDVMLAGYLQVITGYGERAVLRVEA